MLTLHVTLHDDGQLSIAEIVYSTSQTLPVDLVVKNNGKIIHNPCDYSHCLKAHMHYVRVQPMKITYNVARNKNNQLDLALQTTKKILLR